MNILGIIPARGGSKSIPLKNIKSIKGKPLIEYTIDTALKVSEINTLVVSTDHEEIIKVCKKYNDIEIFRRPKELSTDHSPTEDTLLHVCDKIFKRDGLFPDLILTLEPTSPLRTKETIQRCIDVFKNTEADSVIGVVEEKACIGQIKDNKFEFLFPNQPRRRQDRKPLYKESSTIYGIKYSTLKKVG